MAIKHLNQIELADRWNISERTLERWRWTGEGPAYLKIGRFWRLGQGSDIKGVLAGICGSKLSLEKVCPKIYHNDEFWEVLMLIGYARVSTRDQKANLQVDALKAAGCEKIFTETASGGQRDRPELKAAMEYLRSDDVLVVWKLDRLARSVKQLIETVERLDALAAGFKSLTESIDTTTAGGRLIFHVFGALAEFERSIIRERTVAGLAAARARGRTGGRPPALAAKDLPAARAMLKDPDITVVEVARRLGVSPSTLYRHLPGGRSDWGVND